MLDEVLTEAVVLNQRTYDSYHDVPNYTVPAAYNGGRERPRNQARSRATAKSFDAHGAPSSSDLRTSGRHASRIHPGAHDPQPRATSRPGDWAIVAFEMGIMTAEPGTAEDPHRHAQAVLGELAP